MSELMEIVSSVGTIDQPLEGTTADLLASLVEAARSAGAGPRAALRYALEQALSMLVSPPTNERARGGLARWQAKHVDAYIRDHIGSCLKVSELAAQVHLSSGHFSRMFKITFRQTPTAYLMKQRIHYAQERMLTSNCSLAELALDCGFSDQSHFSRVFRRVIGQSPRQWRRDLPSDPNSFPPCRRYGDSEARSTVCMTETRQSPNIPTRHSFATPSGTPSVRWRSSARRDVERRLGPTRLG